MALDDETALRTQRRSTGPDPTIEGSSARRAADHSPVTEALRDAWLRGSLAPNQRLVEAELCRRFAVSRSAVRTALRDLATLGIVELHPHRGARVRKISVDEAVEISQVLMVVEGLAAARAALKATDDDAAHLQRIGLRLRDAVTTADPLGYGRTSAQLHHAVPRIARHGTSQRIIETLRGQLAFHLHQLLLRPGLTSGWLAQHERIVGAIVSRDDDGAESAMRAHLSAVAAQLRLGAARSP